MGTREVTIRGERPPTWREQPVRSVVIASYKKNTDGRYHRHKRMDWNTAQRARRDCFHDATWVEYYTQPRISHVEFPLPTRPPARSAGQSTSKPTYMIRSQQTEEVYPDLSNLRRELERAPRETKRILTGMARSSRGTRRTWKEIKRSSRGIRRD